MFRRVLIFVSSSAQADSVVVASDRAVDVRLFKLLHSFDECEEVGEVVCVRQVDNVRNEGVILS